MCGCTVYKVNFYMILKLSHTRYTLVSVNGDNGTEVISLGGEHGAVCMKTFNGQYNTDSENG